MGFGRERMFIRSVNGQNHVINNCVLEDVSQVETTKLGSCTKPSLAHLVRSVPANAFPTPCTVEIRDGDASLVARLPSILAAATNDLKQ